MKCDAELVLGSMKDDVFVINRHGTIVFVNTAAARRFNGPPEELLGKKVTELFTGMPGQEQLALILEVFRKGFPLYVEAPCTFGKQTVMLGTWLTPVRDNNNEIEAVTGVSRDLTAQYKRKKEQDQVIAGLQESLQHTRIFQGIINMCSQCHRIRDEDGGWTRLETFIHEHTEALISHGFCPECARELFPNLPGLWKSLGA